MNRTYEHQRKIMEQVLAVWAKYPTLRLCQLIVCVTGDNNFHVRDEYLVKLLQQFEAPK